MFSLQLFIYEPDAVRTDTNCNIDWEAELEDPRWYTDEDKTLPSKAKQPPANAKENVARSRTRFQARKEAVSEDNQQEPPQLPVKRVRHSLPKRTILTNQQQSKSHSSFLDLPTATTKTKTNEVSVVKNVVEDLKHLDATSTARAAATTATTSALPRVNITSTTSTVVNIPSTTALPMVNIPSTTATQSLPLPMVSIPSSNVSNGDTQQILNKLRACGVEVKRRNTRETVEIAGDAAAMAKTTGPRHNAKIAIEWHQVHQSKQINIINNISKLYAIFCVNKQLPFFKYTVFIINKIKEVKSKE